MKLILMPCLTAT